MGLFPNGDKEGDKDCGLRKRNEGDSARTVREFNQVSNLKSVQLQLEYGITTITAAKCQRFIEFMNYM